MRVLIITLFAACVMLVLHTTGTSLFLYWTINWFDLLVHGIGGFVIGAFLFFFFAQRPLLFAVSSFIAITCWELFEVFIIRIPAEGIPYVTDTASDILIGVAGVATARLLLRRL